MKAMKMIQKNDKTIKSVCLLACVWTVFCLYSCNDAKLAEQLDGTWHVSYTQKDEDGTPYTEQQDLTFTHIESNGKDGGMFREIVTAEIETEEDDMNVSCKTACTISGEWEIINGDLYMKYDLSSLDVAVKDLDCKLSYNAGLGFSILGIDRAQLKSNIAKEIRKNTYQEMLKVYRQSNDEDSCFGDLSIEGDTLSFTASDLGRMKLTRTK